MFRQLQKDWHWLVALCLIVLGLDLTVLDLDGSVTSSVQAQTTTSGTLYICNGLSYDPTTQGCCNNVIYELATEGCCNNETYDLTTEGCCNGSTVFERDESCCCGGTLKVVCANVRHPR